MSLTFGISPLLLVPALLVALALAVWVYRNTVPELPPLKRIGLTALRAGALGLILFLLFEPFLERRTTIEQRPVLAVLVDNSESLLLADAAGDTSGTGASAREALRSALAGSYPGDVTLYTFGDSLTALHGTSPFVADSLRFTGQRTDIAGALDGIREALGTQNLQGVLLLSDGQYNAGRNPIYLAERFPVPIHTVVLGDTTRRRDLQIRTVTTNEIAFVGDEQPVYVALRAEGYGGEQVQLTLLENGVRLATATAELPTGIGEVPVELRYAPAEEGFRRYTLAVSRLDGEVTYRNNSETITVRVLKNKRRILLLAAAPDPDVAAIRQLLEQDANTEVTAAVQKGNGALYGNPRLDSLDTFDAMILAGFPGRNADPALLQRLATAARAGVPLLVIASRQMDFRRLQDTFGEFLPVQLDLIRSSVSDAALTPTSEGLQHPILEPLAGAADLWQRLPPLAMSDTRWKTTPDARVLAVNEVRGITLDDPLLSLRHRDGLRSAVLLASGIWRWTNVPEDLEDAGQAWTTLFTNLLQWVTTREDDRPVRVTPIEPLFSGGESVAFTGQVYDESLNPIDGAEVDLEVTAADGTRYPYLLDGVGNGQYTLTAGALPEGSYRYTATARRNGVDLGEDQGSFAVGSLTLEFKETGANAGLLRQIAARSGGNFLDPPNLNALPDLLRQSGRFESTFTEERQERELRRLYLFFALVTALLTAEWLIRKRSGLV